MPRLREEIQEGISMGCDFDSLPVLRTFQGLKRGDKVYSKKYGIGKVAELYRDDEIIVDFTELRKRVSELDEEIALIPEESIQKQSKKLEVFIGIFLRV